MKIHRLSKSRFMAGLHCERRLWLLVNRPEDRREPSLAEQHRMEFGIEFGREVTRLFPGGVEITEDYRHPQEALDATASLLQSDAPVTGQCASSEVYLSEEYLAVVRKTQLLFPILRGSARPSA